MADRSSPATPTTPATPSAGALAFARARGWSSTLDAQTLIAAAHAPEPRPGPATFAAALVEGAVLVATADRTIERDELGALAGLLQAMTGQPGDRDELAGVIYDFAALSHAQGRKNRLLALARVLPNEENRHDVLAFTALVALCHTGLSAAERDMLASLATAFSLPPAALDDAVARAQAALSSVPAAG
ncbi:MAG: TerB family tellurite resistance protein [Polyangiaceae bacterium]|nr:TerB family tellurite resistance protein [Polyangiaceae bacterium]